LGDKPHYLDHRDRQRQKFIEHGPDPLADYELLELFLFNSIPRRDVKPIAKDLLSAFGNLAEVCAAPINRLTDIKGIIDRAPVYPREIIRRALELDSTAIILAHNHPSGDPTPSNSDIVMTKEVVKASDAVNITVHDHLIIGRENIASFKTLGLM